MEKKKIAFGDFQTQTPAVLAEEVVQFLRDSGESPDIGVEPTCGEGSFVRAAAATSSKANAIYGFDIKHLCYVVGTYPCPGETFIQREIDALRRRGWTIDVAALDGAAALRPAWGGSWALLGPVLRYALPGMLHDPRLLLRLLRRLPQAAALLNLARARGAGLIHAHFAWLPADVGGFVAAQLGLPFTCSVHAWDVFAQPPAATRRRLRTAVAVCACSASARQAVLDAGLDGRRVHLIRHGLPLAEYPFDPARPADGEILAVGRLEAKKGFEVLIAAIAVLQPSKRNCMIIGAGPERKRLERLIASHGLTGRVVLTGVVTPAEARAAMQRAAILVLPSRRLPSGDRDGLANVLLEAMALGTPVITTEAGAAGEIIQNGCNGWLVSPDDPAALARAMVNVLDDESLRIRCVQAARATIEAAFDADTAITGLERVFEAALE